MGKLTLYSLKLLFVSSLIVIFHCGPTVASPVHEGGRRFNLDEAIDMLKSKSLFSGHHEDMSSHLQLGLRQNVNLQLQKALVSDARKLATENRQGSRNNIRSHLGIDPDAKRDVVELVSSLGYPAEKYTVQTEDGFLLAVQRIPYGRQGRDGPSAADWNVQNKTRPVVFLQHGLLSSAADWVINFANDSLGMVLADHGYDVWLGNSRGNTYSKRHVSLKPDDDRFWDWSFDEMAKYDLPACIDFILNKTGQPSLYYVGHSQGTIIAFAAFSSLMPQYQKKIRLFVGMAPIISLNNVTSPIKYISNVPNEEGYSFFGRKGFMQNDAVIKFIADEFCDKELTNWICYNFDSLIAGYDLANLNMSRLQVYMRHSPAGTSVKNMMHFAQFMRTKTFAMYDFGSPTENLKHYNQTNPPVYNPRMFKIPSLLYTGSKDWLAGPEDVRILESTIPNIVGKYNFPEYNHVDFVVGMDAADKCYKTLLDWLSKY